jgi:hypothetical protein
MENKTIKIFLLLVLIGLLVGCIEALSSPDLLSSVSTQEALTRTSTSQVLPKPTNTLDPAMATNFILSQPTMEAEPLERLILLLKSETCVLPCYLGITPGETSESEVKKILESFGAIIRSGEYSDGNFHYSADLDIGDESLAGLTPDPNRGATDVKIVQNLNILVQDEIVQKIRTSVSTRRFVSRFQEYWSRYSLNEVLQRHGLPDQIYTSTIFYTDDGIGVQLIVVYEGPGIVVYFNGEILDKQVCFDSGKTSADLILILTNPSSQLNPFDPELTPSKHPDIYAPIEEQLNTSKDEFYAQLISNPSTCFDVEKQ